jgi:Probable zinc-ribbon domain
MKSGKQRRDEIKARRRERAVLLHGLDCYAPLHKLPLGATAADPAQLAHNNTYGRLPQFYVDRPFTCRGCGVHEIWTAKQQKWWYEVAKGHIDSSAVRCRPCRVKERARVAEARLRAGHGGEA